MKTIKDKQLLVGADFGGNALWKNTICPSEKTVGNILPKYPEV